jgi:hypothetical protein
MFLAYNLQKRTALNINPTYVTDKLRFNFFSELPFRSIPLANEKQNSSFNQIYLLTGLCIIGKRQHGNTFRNFIFTLLSIKRVIYGLQKRSSTKHIHWGLAEFRPLHFNAMVLCTTARLIPNTLRISLPRKLIQREYDFSSLVILPKPLSKTFQNILFHLDLKVLDIWAHNLWTMTNITLHCSDEIYLSGCVIPLRDKRKRIIGVKLTTNESKSYLDLLMYSRFTLTCFGKLLPSSEGRRCLRRHLRPPEDGNHLPKHVRVNLEYINRYN